MQIRKATDRTTIGSSDMILPTGTPLAGQKNAPSRMQQSVARQYIREKRERGDLGGLVVMDGDQAAGALAFHLNCSSYHRIVRPEYLHLAYIWCMHVEQAYRGQGVRQRLVEHTVNHLRSLGCTSMVLHSVPDAGGFYERTGFAPSTELRRAL
jgi:GNAT superfamily N-acetyltransferase